MPRDPKNQKAPGSKTKMACRLMILHASQGFVNWRRQPDLNRCITVLQTAALPLGYAAGDGLERETGFEPATSTLARLHSTTELFPLWIKDSNAFFRFCQQKTTVSQLAQPRQPACQRKAHFSRRSWNRMKYLTPDQTVNMRAIHKKAAPTT